MKNNPSKKFFLLSITCLVLLNLQQMYAGFVRNGILFPASFPRSRQRFGRHVLSHHMNRLCTSFIVNNVVQTQFKPFASMTMEKNDDASFFSFTESALVPVLIAS